MKKIKKKMKMKKIQKIINKKNLIIKNKLLNVILINYLKN